MILEPYIESWNLVIKNKQCRNLNEWTITDELQCWKDKKVQTPTGSNDLNINISTAFIQTLFQI